MAEQDMPEIWYWPENGMLPAGLAVKLNAAKTWRRWWPWSAPDPGLETEWGWRIPDDAVRLLPAGHSLAMQTSVAVEPTDEEVEAAAERARQSWDDNDREDYAETWRAIARAVLGG